MSAPTFTNSGISYKDSNSTIAGVTGNNQYIVQNLSNLVVTLSASGLATANTGTMSAYECTVGNRTIRVSHTANTACTFDFGTINISRNTSCVIKAIQSNGEYTEASKTILAVPYSPPTANLTLSRTTPDGNGISYIVTGNYSPVKIKGTEKNKISKCVRTTTSYKTDGTSSTGNSNYTSGFTTNSGGVFKISLSLSGTIGCSYDYSGTITDAFGNSATSNVASVSLAIPILSIDSKRGSIGAMCIPEYDSTFQCKMRLDLAKNQYFNSTMKTYGMNAMNSDIIGLNGLFFNDVQNNEGEGIFYPNTGYPVDDIHSRHNWSDTAYDRSKYTQVYWKNKDLYINNEELFCIDDHTTTGWNCYTVNKCGSFRLDLGTYDAGLGDGDGFIILNGDYKLQMDGNEILASASGALSYLGISASQLGLNASQGCRLRYGNDVDVSSGNWSGLTLEGGSFNGETFTTNNQVLRLDGNEIICCNNSSKLQELYIRSSNCHISDGTTTLDTLVAQNTTLGITSTSTLTTDASITAGNIKTYANTIENIKTGSNGWMYLKTNLNSSDSATFITGYDSSNGAFMRHAGTYSKTNTSTANVYITSGGVFYRTTSSAKAKLDIVPAFDSIDDYKKILNIEPVKWFDKTAMETNADVMTAEYNGETTEHIEIPNMNRVYGCVAEQLEEVGLDCLVEYDNENKEIAGVAYDRIPIMYIPLFKDLYNQIDELKDEIKKLKG